MKRGKQSLERVYFNLWLCNFQLFSLSFKINRMAVRIFVKNWLARLPTVNYCSFFFFLEGKVCLALEDSKKSLGCMHVFLIKFSYGPGTRKPFAWKVMLSVLSLLIMHDFLLSSIALWSSFASVCKHYLSLSNTKSDTFFYWPS